MSQPHGVALWGGSQSESVAQCAQGGRLPYCAEWVAEGRFQPLGLSTGLGRRMCSTSDGAELLWVLALWAADLDSDGIVGDGANASSGGALWPVAGTARSGSVV